MGFRKRMETAQHRFFGVPDRLFAREAARHHGMHNREQVLGAMLELARQQLVPRLGQYLLGDVTRNF